MERFIEIPYLPEGNITLSVSARKARGRVIAPYGNANLPEGIRTHTDLTICYLGGGAAVAAPEAYDYYVRAFSGTGLTVIRGGTRLDMHYPADCAYNVAPVGKKLFCNASAADGILLSEAEKRGYKIVDIKQGYAKCSVCPVTETAAISADISFCRAAEKEGIDTLLITNDAVLLPGYANGFFGGAAYMKNPRTLVTAGSVDRHPDGGRIKAFLQRYGINAEADSDAPLFDFGSLCAVMCE